MFLKPLHLTAALRPSYLSDEDLLFVQDSVGLYKGDKKLPLQQNGQVYLTSHRICYVDKAEPRQHSAAVDLKDVASCDFYGRFLKSSPKVTLTPIPPRPRPAGACRTVSPAGPVPEFVAANWVCEICYFSNPVPENFDPQTANPRMPLPACLSCGMAPSLGVVLKAAVSNASNRAQAGSSGGASGAGDGGSAPQSTATVAAGSGTKPGGGSSSSSKGWIECPSCTFHNHPSMLSCEMCLTSLSRHHHHVPQLLPPSAQQQQLPPRTGSPLPSSAAKTETAECIRYSFRGGGEKPFYDRLKNSLTQRKWLLQAAPPIPRSSQLVEDPTGRPGPAAAAASVAAGETSRPAGIAGLEQLGLNMRRNNEMIIGSAFEDLDALMAYAKQVTELAEQFARQTLASASASASAAGAATGEAGRSGAATSPDGNALLAAQSASQQLGLVATRDIVGSGRSDDLYISELSRNLAEFLTDDTRAVLRRAGGVMSLVDLWAVFNRARGGVELVSPAEFERAARLWETLRLPVRLRRFRSGALVVQASDRNDDTTVRALLGWLRDLHDIPPDARDIRGVVAWDWRRFGYGVTARDAAGRFGWSVGVAEEELIMAEDRGVLCREEGIEGLKFWENWIDDRPATSSKERDRDRDRPRSEKELVAGLKMDGLLV